MTGGEALSVRVEDSDPLETAGRRLDAAAAELDRLCEATEPLPDETGFGLAETAFVAARNRFRRLLAVQLGLDAEALARRLSL